MKNRRFFWQIFPAALFVIILSISAASWYGTRMIQSFHYHEMQNDIEDRALLLRPHINQLLKGDHEYLQDFCRQTGRAAATRITVIAGDGIVLADSNENPAQMDNHGTRPEIETAATGEMGAALRFSKTLSQNMLYVAIPLQNDAPNDGVLRLSVSAAALDAIISSIRQKLLLGILFIALMAAGLSYYQARRISRATPGFYFPASCWHGQHVATSPQPLPSAADVGHQATGYAGHSGRAGYPGHEHQRAV